MKKIKTLVATTLSVLVCAAITTNFSANAENAGKKNIKVNPAHSKYKKVEVKIKGEKSKKKRASGSTSDIYVHNFSDCPVTVAVVDSVGLVDTFSLAAHDDYYRSDVAYTGYGTVYFKSYSCETEWKSYSHNFKPYEVYDFSIY